MRVNQEDTPPSSINGDEIGNVEEEGIIFYDELEQIELDDEDMEEGTDQEEEDRMELPIPPDHAMMSLHKHMGSVFSCGLHPEAKFAVTGAEDDKAYVWSVETGQVAVELQGHVDSVIFVGFSFDGAYVASADMSGVIKVRKVDTEELRQPWTVAFEYEADDLTWGLWHFGARVLIVGTATGDTYIFKIPSGETKVLQGYNNKVECGKLFPDGVRLAAGYEDGSVKIWDLKTSSIIHQVPSSVHQMRVTAIDVHPDNSLIASISTDGKVVLTTSSNGRVVGQLDAGNDLETVTFSPDPQLGYLALGTLSGVVSIWDVARQMLRHECRAGGEGGGGGVTCLAWAGGRLLAGCLDGAVRVFDPRSGSTLATLTGHRSEILDLSYNAKENLIITSSDDSTARIYKFDVNNDND